MLHSNRQPIIDVPAVYFCEPSRENVKRITEDVQHGLYSSFSLNFTTTLPRPLLEELAMELGSKELPEGNGVVADKISKVYDQYINYECLEDGLFSLCLENVFGIFNGVTNNEDALNEAMDRQAIGLFSVLLSCGGQLPLIAAQRGSGGEGVAQKLEARLRNYVANSKSSSLGPSLLDTTDDLGLQRPCIYTHHNALVLVVLDRSFDWTTPFRHASTYAALVADVFNLKHNRCTYTDASSTRRTFNVDGDDWIWRENSAKPFPSVAEAVDSALQSYKTEHEQITRKQSGSGADDLRMAMQVLPELTERKRLIDNHLVLCQTLLNAIKERELGEYFAMEQSLDKQMILDWLNNPNSPGTLKDKFRLFSIYFLIKGNETWERDCQAFLNRINQDVDLKRALLAVKKYHDFIRLSNPLSSPISPTLHNNADDSDHLMGKLRTAGGGLLSGLAASVKQWLPENQDLPITKQLDSLLDALCNNASYADKWTLSDPKMIKGEKVNFGGRGKSAFNHVIVYVVGGISYSEYDQMKHSWHKRHTEIKAVTCGSDQLIGGDQFISLL